MWRKNTGILTKAALLLLLSIIGERLYSLNTSSSSTKQETLKQNKKTISLKDQEMEQMMFSEGGGMKVVIIFGRAYWIDPTQPLDKRLMVCDTDEGEPVFSTRQPVDVSKLNDNQVGFLMKYVLDPIYEAQKEN